MRYDPPEATRSKSGKNRSKQIASDEEKDFLARYKPGAFARPSLTVDIVVLTIVDAELRVLMVKRKEHPFKNHWALPGGFVRVRDGQDQGEDLDEAAARELEEETSIEPNMVYLEQLHTFGKAGRDPRMRVITVAYYALVRPDLVPMVRAGGDASETTWYAVRSLKRLPLAFDHAEIVKAAVGRVVSKLDDSDTVFNLVPQTFTIPELRSVHEIIAGVPQDRGNFRRRFNRMLEDGILEQAPGKRITTSKPASVYRFRRSRESM